MAEPWQTEKKKLEALHNLVHNAVRMLKMDDRSTISCGPFTPEEVRAYLWGYAFHKRKWFNSIYDPTSKVYYVQRTRPPKPPQPLEDEEEEL